MLLIGNPDFTLTSDRRLVKASEVATVKSAAESMELIRSLSSVYDNMSEEDLAENGMTPEQVTQMKDYIDKMVKIGEVYAACTVEKGCRLKLNADVDGTASVIEKTVLLVNGSWVFSDFSDMLG